jgi:hypothetical protein
MTGLLVMQSDKPTIEIASIVESVFGRSSTGKHLLQCTTEKTQTFWLCLVTLPLGLLLITSRLKIETGCRALIANVSQQGLLSLENGALLEVLPLLLSVCFLSSSLSPLLCHYSGLTI